MFQQRTADQMSIEVVFRHVSAACGVCRFPCTVAFTKQKQADEFFFEHPSDQQRLCWLMNVAICQLHNLPVPSHRHMFLLIQCSYWAERSLAPTQQSQHGNFGCSWFYLSGAPMSDQWPVRLPCIEFVPGNLCVTKRTYVGAFHCQLPATFILFLQCLTAPGPGDAIWTFWVSACGAPRCLCDLSWQSHTTVPT